MNTACITTTRLPAVLGWRVWAVAGAVGLVCELPAPCLAQAQSPGSAPGAEQAQRSPLLRLGLTASTHVVYAPRPYAPPHEVHVRPPGQPSLALEFKSPKKDQGPRSLLRVQLSGDSVLHFRPRGGGLTVTYRSQF